MLFGGNFVLRTHLPLTALNSTTSACHEQAERTLLAKAMEEGLGVVPNRGVIKFLAMSEDNLATDGKTITAKLRSWRRNTLRTTRACKELVQKHGADQAKTQHEVAANLKEHSPNT